MIEVASFFQRCSYVKKIPIFSALSWFNIQLVARYGELCRYKKGDVVSQKGSQPDYVFFLTSGRLQSYSLDSDGRKDDIEFIHRGMFFGIISALTGEEHSQTFEAINDSVLFRISVPRFRKILKRLPDLGLKFGKALSQRIRSKVMKTNLVPRSTIISVYSPIAGAGGSTYAFNLALSLHKETSDKVIFVTIRSAKPAEHSFNSDIDEVRPKWKRVPCNLSNLIGNFETIPNLVSRDGLGVDLLNVVFNPEDKAIVGHISDFVSSFIDEYRYIIVDLPSDMDDVVMKTLSQSDLIHLVMLRKREALETGRVVLDRLAERMKETFNEERVRVIVSGVNVHRNMSPDSVRGILDYDIEAFLPHVQHKDLAMLVETAAINFYALNGACSYIKVLSRVSRQISGVSLGLVLGGGAAFGLAHIGVLKVLEEENIQVDVIAGSSMGALIGSLWSVGYSAHDLEKLAYEFRNKSNLIKLLDFVFPLSGLISGKAVMVWLRSKLGKKTFHDARVPLKVIAYDLIHRQDVVLEEGSLVEAIRKSISIPGVFQPIIGDDQLIIDGGVMNPLPVNVLASAGVKKIVAVNVLQSPEDVIQGYQKMRKGFERALEKPFLRDPWHFIEIRLKFWLNKMFFPNISDIIVRTLEASESVIANQSARLADVVLHPDLAGLNWYELYNAEVLIKRGEDVARRHIDKIRQMVNKKTLV